MVQANKRYLRLPSDDPEDVAAAVERARTIDRDTKFHDLPLPVGPHLESANPQALMFAKMGVREPVRQKFKLKRKGRRR